MLYYEQVFVFCRLINKSALEWFILIMCKWHILIRSTNLCSRNHSILCFWLDRFMPLICYIRPDNIRKLLIFWYFRGCRMRPVAWNGLRRDDRQMPITEQLLHQTMEKSHQKRSIKKVVRKNFVIFKRKHLCSSNMFYPFIGNVPAMKFLCRS